MHVSTSIIEAPTTFYDDVPPIAARAKYRRRARASARRRPRRHGAQTRPTRRRARVMMPILAPDISSPPPNKAGADTPAFRRHDIHGRGRAWAIRVSVISRWKSVDAMMMLESAICFLSRHASGLSPMIDFRSYTPTGACWRATTTSSSERHFAYAATISA